MTRLLAIALLLGVVGCEQDAAFVDDPSVGAEQTITMDFTTPALPDYEPFPIMKSQGTLYCRQGTFDRTGEPNCEDYSVICFEDMFLPDTSPGCTEDSAICVVTTDWNWMTCDIIPNMGNPNDHAARGPSALGDR